VAPTVVRASLAEAAIRGRALTHETIAAGCDALARDFAPIDDLRSTAEYRLQGRAQSAGRVPVVGGCVTLDTLSGSSPSSTQRTSSARRAPG
jgi:CO dehydrogenase flavoprotein C-terminal domain